MPITREIYRRASATSRTTYGLAETVITAMDRDDGSPLLVIDQANMNRSDINEDDRIALDEAAQLVLYKHLHTQFGAR